MKKEKRKCWDCGKDLDDETKMECPECYITPRRPAKLTQSKGLGGKEK